MQNVWDIVGGIKKQKVLKVKMQVEFRNLSYLEWYEEMLNFEKGVAGMKRIRGDSLGRGGDKAKGFKTSPLNRLDQKVEGGNWGLSCEWCVYRPWEEECLCFHLWNETRSGNFNPFEFKKCSMCGFHPTPTHIGTYVVFSSSIILEICIFSSLTNCININHCKMRLMSDVQMGFMI